MVLRSAANGICPQSNAITIKPVEVTWVLVLHQMPFAELPEQLSAMLDLVSMRSALPAKLAALFMKVLSVVMQEPLAEPPLEFAMLLLLLLLPLLLLLLPSTTALLLSLNQV